MWPLIDIMICWFLQVPFLSKTGKLHYWPSLNTDEALYEVKWVLFKWVFYSCPPYIFLPSMRHFNWGTAQSSTSRSIRITTSQSQKYQKRSTLWSKLGWPKVWLLVFLMSLKIELHAVPHLKGLNDGKNISGWQECDNAFT